MTFRTRVLSAAIALGVGGLSAEGASADTFAVFNPTDAGVNVALSGLTLSASTPVVFDYTTAGLAPLGDLAAQWTLTATETGAVAFGPIALGSFDGSFALTYSGPTVSAGGYTVHTGDDLLSGTFLGAVFAGYGTTATVTDSVSAGGLVSFNNNPLLAFDPTADQGLGLALSSLAPSTTVSSGRLNDFSASASGSFSANTVSPPPVTVPEPRAWSLLLAGFAGVGGALRVRRRADGARSHRRLLLPVTAALAACLTVLSAGGAKAATIATFRPSGNTSNIALSGLNLTASAPVVFAYKVPGAAALGNLKATWSLNATETGAIAFGPIDLASFDGSFGFTYSGPTKTVGAYKVQNGADLLSGSFLGGVFQGYGSSGGLSDSILAGGLVSFNNNSLLTFSGIGDEGLAVTLGSLSPKSIVVGGELTAFTAVGSGNFATGVAPMVTPNTSRIGSAFAPTTSAVPEPATWVLMLMGLGGLGAASRVARRSAASPRGLA